MLLNICRIRLLSPRALARTMFAILFCTVTLLLTSTGFSVQQTAHGETARLKRMRKINPAMPLPMRIDDERVAGAGISVFHGKHITLYTDARPTRTNQTGKPIDTPQQWVALFDAAVDEWCERFDIDRADAKDYSIRAMVIVSAERFEKARLIPDDLPKFPAGYSRGHEFWMFAQKDDYYTRHLILHEGTHAFMNWFLGSTGPPWFSEGMAEWIALHQWDDKTTENEPNKKAPVLKLAAKISAAESSQGWGRIGRIKKMVANDKAMSLDDVLNIPPIAFREVDYYAWSWAACEFFSEHPLSARAFTRLPHSFGRVTERSNRPGSFNQAFVAAIKAHRPALNRDWALFINEIDYGYNVRAARLTKAASISLGKAGRTEKRGKAFEISATQSWQSTGIPFRRGDRMQIDADGQFVVGETTKPWVSQPAGITIDYYAGQPLGRLMACIAGTRLTEQDEAEMRKVEALSVGNGPNVVTAPHDGVLWLRINESPSHLRDNSGHLEVSILRLK